MQTLNLKRLTVIVSTLVALGLLAGCGDSSPSNTPDAGIEAGTGDGPSGLQTIAEIAIGNPDFSTLVAAVQKAELVDVISGAGPFTVFAPNNKAFEDAGITSLDGFTKEQLQQIILYHVIQGATVKAADVKAGPVTSAADLTFFIGTDSGVTINGGNAVSGGANVVATDIEASNGVIHVIDRVMLPPDIPTLATYGGLGELVNAVVAAGNVGNDKLVDVLKGAGPFTVFAPTDDAFKAIAAPTDPDALRDVLLYHAIGASVASDAIPPKADSLLQNKWGNGVTLLFDTSSGAKVNDASVVIADLKATNGVVHVIDKVLLPPNIVDMATIAGFSELLGAVGAAADLPGPTKVADALAADKPYTVFAPTNAAFGAITPPTDPAVLRDVLLLHVVEAAAPVLSSGLPSTPVDTLLSGEQLSFNAGGPSVSSAGTAGAAIGPFDINVTNGVIHVIDKVLLP
ncbi:MAG: fasciclin domain-containing protein [Myxococcales bacterium]|nr:fasciclin domain-containing protein [Myxococcales bacterium]